MRADRAGIGAAAPLLVSLWLLAGCAAGPTPVRSDGALLAGRIAHAGGAIRGATYTNSLEALDHNYAAGFRFFEIDLIWTRDDALVALHDWSDNFRKLFGTGFAPPLSRAEFERAVADGVPGFHLPVLEELLAWLAAHPDALLVTDVKDRNLEALALIARKRPKLRARIIPQIYRPGEYAPVRGLGYPSIIWTLYRHPLGDFEIVRQVRHMSLFAVAMPASRARQGRLAPYLARLGIATLAHTVNRPGALTELRRRGITDVFTDYLPPCDPPSPACAVGDGLGSP